MNITEHNLHCWRKRSQMAIHGQCQQPLIKLNKLYSENGILLLLQ